VLLACFEDQDFPVLAVIASVNLDFPRADPANGLGQRRPPDASQVFQRSVLQDKQLGATVSVSEIIIWKLQHPM
jgi:hypothetical protein